MKRGLFAFLIFPLCMMLFSNTAYRHHHIMPDGMKIAHAHPVNNPDDDPLPGSSHNHSDTELLLLSLFTDSPASLSANDFCPEAFYYNECEFINLQAQTDLIRRPLNQKLLRAPPADYLS